MNQALLRAEQLGKSYKSANEERWVFRHIDLQYPSGESLSLTGPVVQAKVAYSTYLDY